MIQCTNCGYPVINGMHTCPNCLAEMPEEIVTPLLVEEDVYEYNDEEIPYCSLRPISLPGEKEMREKVYEEGAEVYISRNNTVPNDNTIDKDEQACLFFSDGYWFIEDRSCLFFSDGYWFIEDRSQNNSTYVHAGAGIKLEPGDIIKMGDRLFEFNVITKKK